MIDPANVPAVGTEKLLARYVLQRSHIRRSNQTVKPDAFMPHPHTDMSVTRHWSATEAELWSVGEAVADASGKTLHGRGDIRAEICVGQALSVIADPTPDNPNHANVAGWPTDKPRQKAVAQEIAATAQYVDKP
ncbi:MAG: hypothetical protein HYS13_13840 [Planctomycetia bacterium]|nr:hypothetical protein [Planctomycetia bacterium]